MSTWVPEPAEASVIRWPDSGGTGDHEQPDGAGD